MKFTIEQPKFGVLILNYNGMRWLPALYESLANDRYPHKHVYLVDNMSSDQSIAYTTQHYPELTVLRLSENLGYSMAYNLAMKAALDDGCEWLCLLNSDTVVLPGWIDRLAEASADPSIGIMGPVQWDWDHDEPNQFMSRYNFTEPNDSNCGPLDCDWIEGSCLCVRRECFQDVGPLDPSYFFYWEDADYCRRAKYHDWRVVVVPESRIRHFGGGSSGGGKSSLSTRLDRLNLRNYYRFNMSDPNRNFASNVFVSFKLFLTLQKQTFLSQKRFSIAKQHLLAFVQVLRETHRCFTKWRLDREKAHPDELIPDCQHANSSRLN